MAIHLFSSTDASGLACFVTGRPIQVIPWDQIDTIRAFHRRDERLEYAVVWLRVPQEMFPVEFTERDPRWPELLQGFSQYLRAVVLFEKWFPREIHPVFEKNTHGVYSKEA
jgi:hypothetical protein